MPNLRRLFLSTTSTSTSTTSPPPSSSSPETMVPYERRLSPPAVLPLLSKNSDHGASSRKENPSPPGRRALRYLAYRAQSGRNCCRMCCGCLVGLVVLVYSVLYVFHPNVKGVFLMVARTHLPFLDTTKTYSPFSTSNGKVCVMQAMDASHKIKYADFLQRNKQWAEANGMEYVPYMAEFHHQRFPNQHNQQQQPDTLTNTEHTNANYDLSSYSHAKLDHQQPQHPPDMSGLRTSLVHNIIPWELKWYNIDPATAQGKPHFLKFHGMKYLLFDENNGHNCDYVMYIDSDAVIGVDVDINSNANEPPQPLPLNYAPLDSPVDVVFGNEVFVAAMDSMRRNPNNLPFNSGYILVKKSDFSRQFIDDVLTHPRCDICRIGPCTIFGYFDQGCMEKLFQHEYSDKLDHFAVAPIQTTTLTPGYLLCHLAGLNKNIRRGGCMM